MLAAGLATRYGGCKPLAPVGLAGEALVDLTASDAFRAGFDHLVIVVGPSTGPAIRYHVRRLWPGDLDVDFVEQDVPLGTAHAVLCAEAALRGQGPFAVVNADDIYGEAALTLLQRYLKESAGHGLVAYALRNTLSSDAPVTRGVCSSVGGGSLGAVTERRLVRREADGRITSSDGLDPVELDPDVLVSMNLWGFGQSIFPALESAVEAFRRRSGAGASGAAGTPRPGGQRSGAVGSSAKEVLLPDVVAGLVGQGEPFTLLRTDEPCIGVTHASDIPSVTAALAESVSLGLRPQNPW